MPWVALPSGSPALNTKNLHFLKNPLWQIGPCLLQMTLNNTALCTRSGSHRKKVLPSVSLGPFRPRQEKQTPCPYSPITGGQWIRHLGLGFAICELIKQQGFTERLPRAQVSYASFTEEESEVRQRLAHSTLIQPHSGSPTGSLFALNHPPNCGPEQRGRLLWLADFYCFLFILYSPLSDLNPCLATPACPTNTGNRCPFFSHQLAGEWRASPLRAVAMTEP